MFADRTTMGVKHVALELPWPAGGPPVVWRRTLGQGFSGMVVADERVFKAAGARRRSLEARRPRPGGNVRSRRVCRVLLGRRGVRLVAHHALNEILRVPNSARALGKQTRTPTPKRGTLSRSCWTERSAIVATTWRWSSGRQCFRHAFSFPHLCGCSWLFSFCS